MAPEGRGVFANLTVLENLEMGAYLTKDKAAVRRDLDRGFTLFPRLKERIKQRAGTLSGGEQQMLSIARALMSHPKLLLLDEPSLGLAPIVCHTIFSTIDEIKMEGTTVLLVEQNANAALKHSDRGYVLETGRGDSRRKRCGDCRQSARARGLFGRMTPSMFHDLEHHRQDRHEHDAKGDEREVVLDDGHVAE